MDRLIIWHGKVGRQKVERHGEFVVGGEDNVTDEEIEMLVESAAGGEIVEDGGWRAEPYMRPRLPEPN